MTQQHRTALKELQKLDVQILDARERIRDFDPLFEEVEEPALQLESELNTTRNRVKEMKLEERRVQLATTEREERLKKLEERLGSVRNLREEAAVSAELDMVRRALQGDEQETLSLIDQIRKAEGRLEELETSFAEASAMVEPKREELIASRDAARSELERLENERSAFAGGVEKEELRVYEAIRGGGRRAAVAELTDDGACGNCFWIVPLQHQNEVRHGQQLIRCEGCGVILAAPEPETEASLAAKAAEAEAVAAASAAAAADDGSVATPEDEVGTEPGEDQASEGGDEEE
jgi:predicted  nucleic acid-binding Zn-ribbon protein